MRFTTSDNLIHALSAFKTKLDSTYAAKSHGTHLTLGTTSSTAYRGDLGNTAYAHSQAAHAPSNAQKNSDITKAEIEAKLTGSITSHTHNYAAASHTSDTTSHITADERTAWNAKSNLALGTTSSTAYRGDRGNTAYTHSQAAHAPSNAQKNSDITKAEIEAKLTGAVSSHTHTIANITDMKIKNGASSIKVDDPNQTWAHTDIKNNAIVFGGDYSSHTTTDANIAFCSSVGKINMVIDGEYYANEGKQRVYHTGYKPTPADIGAAAASHGTHLTIGTGASNAAAGNHNHTQLTGEVRFPGSGTYSDPWSGTACAIKATGNIGCSGSLRANSGIATCGGPNGVATSDGATYVANFRYAQSRGICDLGSNSVPGRLYIRSGQGTAGSGVYIENKVTDGRAYMQYLSPEAGTIALTSHLSDRTRKDNIVYTNDEKSNFSNNDFYNFIKDDLDLATYTLKENYAATDTHTKLNFIAQDILWDFNRNEENKVGNLIVQAEAAMESQYSLKYDADNFIAVIAGALKEAINEIELLKSKNEELIERLLKIELNEGGE